MSLKWTNDQELTFIDCLQAEPVLWKTSIKDYKNKTKNHDAWVRISAIMEIPVDDLKTKKNSLLASYRGYRNKVKKSVNSGAGAEEVYKPIWFAYEAMDSVFGDSTTCKSTIDTETQSSRSDERHEEEEWDFEEGPEGSQRNLNTTASRAEPTIRRKIDPPELFEAGKVVKEALATFKATVKRNESQTQPIRSTQDDDDCDLYGKLLAKKLRKMPEEKRLRLMHSIDGFFLSSQYTTEHSESSSPISTPTPSSSPKPQNYFNKFNRGRNLYGEPRPGSSFTSYSDPAINHYSPMANQNPYNHSRSSSSNNVIIHSNETIYPPVISIQEQNAGTTDDITEDFFQL